VDLYDVLKTRYSVRSYSAREVPPESIDRIVAAFNDAPTAANRQPFGLLLVTTAGRESGLQRVYGRTWFTQAPLVAVVCTVPANAWVRADGKNYADVDAARGAGHLLDWRLRPGRRARGVWPSRGRRAVGHDAVGLPVEHRKPTQAPAQAD